jgi:hypothetical protein
MAVTAGHHVAGRTARGPSRRVEPMGKRCQRQFPEANDRNSSLTRAADGMLLKNPADCFKVKLARGPTIMSREPEIYCPVCQWHPHGDSRWICARSKGGCGSRWNTFWTGGCCPGCGHHWETTQCLACKQVSPHVDWYHFPPEEDAQQEKACELTV